MLKLYKKTSSGLQYWEAWTDENELTFHWGHVGETGQTRIIQLNGQTPNTVIKREAKVSREQGYRKIPASKLLRITIQYRVGGMGTAEDLDKRIKVENLMNDRLGWLGLGHCDGGDMGSGTMNVFCMVVDCSIAIRHIIRELRISDLIKGAAISIRSDRGDSVVWPRGISEGFLM